MIQFLQSLHSAEGLRTLIETGGLIVVAGIVFAETGLLAGFFLPGDSLLVTAGIFASSEAFGGKPLFDIYTLIGLVTSAAVIGDQSGYFLGKKAGPLIYKEKDSLFFKKHHLMEAESFYKRNGPRALVAARFVPIFRTFVPFVAGLVGMRYLDFLRYSVIGGILWVTSMCTIGFYLGRSRYGDQLHKVILVVILISILPIIIGTTKKILARRHQPPAVLTKKD